MKSVGSYEAKTHLPRLLSQVEKGETITITKRGRPVAVLSPAQQVPERDVSGRYRGIPGLQQGACPQTWLPVGPRNQGHDRGGTALSKKKASRQAAKGRAGHRQFRCHRLVLSR